MKNLHNYKKIKIVKKIEFKTWNKWKKSGYIETWSKTNIAVRTYDVNINETYLELTSFFGLRRDVVKNAWSLITEN